MSKLRQEQPPNALEVKSLDVCMYVLLVRVKHERDWSQVDCHRKCVIALGQSAVRTIYDRYGMYCSMVTGIINRSPLKGIVFRGIFLEALCKSRGTANWLRDLRGSAGGLIYYCK